MSWLGLLSRAGRAARPARIKSRVGTARSILRFMRHNRSAWERLPRSRHEILIESYGVCETLIAFSYFANVLTRRGYGRIVRFEADRTTRWLDAVYRSFNTDGLVQSVRNGVLEKRITEQLEAVLPRLESKQDLFDLQIDGVAVGRDVYEAYLRDGRATVDLEDPVLRRTLQEGIGLLVFWSDYLDSHDVRAVLSSHDCYLPNVLNQIAYKRGIPVFFPNARGLTRASVPYAIYDHFASYRERFAAFPDERRSAGLAGGRDQLSRRFAGTLDLDYAVGTAFHDHRSAPVLRRSERLKVLVCSHCFFDNPHAYGGFLFTDFWEWFQFLGRIATRTDYDWYVKLHPEPMAGTVEVVNRILADHPRLTLIPSGTSHYQLAEEGIDWVLTGYGSVGEEYPALGVPVVNAGYNPRIAYSFNLHPRSVEEYERILLSLDRIQPPPLDREQLHEFLYMNHQYVIEDDFVFPSWRRMMQEVPAPKRVGPSIFDYFLDRLNPARHARIIERMDDFVASGRTHLFD